MSNVLSTLPHLGVGLGFRPSFLSELFCRQDTVDFLEVTSEHYLQATPEKKDELALLKDHFPIIPHGLNMSLGSAEGIDEAYLEQVAALVEYLDPPWWSEHICFSRAGGVDIGHLSPMPFHQESLDTFCRNVEYVQSVIQTPLILENITYTVPIPGSTMSEAHFVRRLLDEVDCGLLLDVTNLFTNSINHAYDAVEFLDTLPFERIVQLHLAGGFWENGMLLDTHSRPVQEEVWELLRAVLQRVSVQGIILERDEDIPTLAELSNELERARHCLRDAKHASICPSRDRAST